MRSGISHGRRRPRNGRLQSRTSRIVCGVVASTVLFAAVGGCVRRTVTINTAPQGARVILNDEYVGTGVERQTVTSSTDSAQSSLTFIDNFRMIGKGRATSLHVHEVFHVTVNTDGEITASIDRASLECR